MNIVLKNRGKKGKFMQKTSSKSVIGKLINLFDTKFEITRENENRFYFDNAYYSPDLVFRNKNGKIIALIEVEQGTRKHIVGGIVTADYCMGLLKEKPVFCLLALAEDDLKDYKKREKMLMQYIKHINKVVIGDFGDIRDFLAKL